jgi:hypothetical protein
MVYYEKQCAIGNDGSKLQLYFVSLSAD